MNPLSIVWRLGSWSAPLVSGMSLGVQVACIDEAGRPFLVRHTYRPGWYFPGGGVEGGETLVEAAVRELREEVGIVPAAEPAMFGAYLNRKRWRSHVVLFVCRSFDVTAPPAFPNSEIAEASFFLPDALPEGTTAATRRRLDEINGVAAQSTLW